MWQSFKGLVGCAGNVLRNQYHFQMGLDVTAFRGLGSFRTLDLVSWKQEHGVKDGAPPKEDRLPPLLSYSCTLAALSNPAHPSSLTQLKTPHPTPQSVQTYVSNPYLAKATNDEEGNTLVKFQTTSSLSKALFLCNVAHRALLWTNVSASFAYPAAAVHRNCTNSGRSQPSTTAECKCRHSHTHALPFCREAAPVASAALAGAMYRGPMPVVTTLHVLDLGDMMVILVQTARACRGFSTRRNGDL